MQADKTDFSPHGSPMLSWYVFQDRVILRELVDVRGVAIAQDLIAIPLTPPSRAVRADEAVPSLEA